MLGIKLTNKNQQKVQIYNQKPMESQNIIKAMRQIWIIK